MTATATVTTTTTTTIEWVCETYSLTTMSEEALDELYDNIIGWWEGIDDRFEAGRVTSDWHKGETAKIKIATKAIEVEFERRERLSEPEPEPPAPRGFAVPAENKVILEVLEMYSNVILTKLEAELRRRGFAIADFSYAGKSKRVSRIGAAWEIAKRGGWTLPVNAGQPFVIDSQAGQPGNLRYQVYCAAVPNHRGNQCDCYDGTRHGDDLGCWCKHVLAAYLLFLASSALVADQPGREVVAA